MEKSARREKYAGLISALAIKNKQTPCINKVGVWITNKSGIHMVKSAW